MRTKTLCDYPLLIGELLRRHEARERRKFLNRHKPPFWLPITIGLFIGGWAFGIGHFVCWIFGL